MAAMAAALEAAAAAAMAAVVGGGALGFAAGAAVDAGMAACSLRGAALALGADEIAAIALLLEDQKCSSTELAAHLEQATARFNTAVHRILQIS